MIKSLINKHLESISKIHKKMRRQFFSPHIRIPRPKANNPIPLLVNIVYFLYPSSEKRISQTRDMKNSNILL